MTRGRLHLLEVVVQPVFVVEDDDGFFGKLAVDPIVVAAREWPTFATERFVRLSDALDGDITGGGPA